MNFPTVVVTMTRQVGVVFAVIGILSSSEGVLTQAFSDLASPVRDFVSVAATHVVIRDVRIIDGTGAPARPGMSLEIRDGRIARPFGI